MTIKREQSSNIIKPGENVHVGGFRFYRWVDFHFAGADGEVALFIEYNTHNMDKCVLLGLEHMIKSKYGCITPDMPTARYIHINIPLEQADTIIRFLLANHSEP